MKYFKLTIVVLFATIINIQAQERRYKEMMLDPNINFYTVCDSADAYFKDRDKGKGSGYTPYQRWKYENEAKYFPSGNRLLDQMMPYKEYDRIYSEQKNTSKLFTSGGWQNLGPDSITKITGHYSAGIGRVEYVEVNKINSQQIYLGSRSGGLWRTSNGGNTWSHNTDFLQASGVNAIAASPTNFDSVLINVQTGEFYISFGIYRSINGGLTFTPTNFTPINVGYGGLGSNFKVYVIKYHPRIPNLVFVGTSQGLYRSTDNLQTWTRQIIGGDVYDIDFHPINNDIIYIYDGFFSANKNKVLKSTDRGITYVGLPDLPGNANAKIKITVPSSCPNCVYASSDNGIWKSLDTGTTFSTIVSPAPAGVSLYSALPNDLDTSKIISGYFELSRSLDGGQTFNKCTWWYLPDAVHGSGTIDQNFKTSPKYVHADNNYIDCVNGIFYTCTDGFLCKSIDNGLNWTRISNTVGIRENYCLGTSQSNHYTTICGSQDNGTSLKKATEWWEVYGADGMEGLIHPLNPNYLMGSTQNGGRRKSVDGGINTTGAAPASSTASWVAPMFYDPNNHMTLYTFGTIVYKSTDFGSSWINLGSPVTFAGSVIQVAAIAETNSQLIIIANNDKIELSTNGGTTFTNIKNTLPTRTISDIAFHPKRDSTIIVTYRDYQNNGQKVYISTNLGATWTNITFNLGNMPIHSVVIDHTDSSNIYLGAEIGVYKKSMIATTWSLYNPNLPNVTVKELEINYGSNTLKAATWGRGLWEYSLANRNTYPAVLNTKISSSVTDLSPKVNVPQIVESEINYAGTISKVFVKWSINNLNFNRVINMSNIVGNIWRADSTLPYDSVGNKIYFKVFAVGAANDTTETYKFMYDLKPYQFCTASGENVNGNLWINNLTCDTVSNNGTGYSVNSFFANKPITLRKDSTYTLTATFSQTWSSNDLVVWIDYNNDAVFDNSERVIYDINTGGVGTGTFTVPATSVSDTVKMRVRLGYWGGFDDPCGTSLGEVEDYPVIIPAVAPINLPVELISFTGDKLDDGNLLKWITNTEINNDYFNLERSANANEFSTISTIDGAGNSSINQSYFYLDKNPLVGLNYYRLKQVDLNGTYEYSNIIVLNNLSDKHYFIYPNPVIDELFIDIKNTPIITYKIINQKGQLKKAGTIQANNSIIVSDLPSGIYYLIIENKEYKFLKK